MQESVTKGWDFRQRKLHRTCEAEFRQASSINLSNGGAKVSRALVFGRSSRGARPPCFFGSFRISCFPCRALDTLFAPSSSAPRRASTGHLGAPPGGERTNLSASRHLWSNPLAVLPLPFCLFFFFFSARHLTSSFAMEDEDSHSQTQKSLEILGILTNRLDFLNSTFIFRSFTEVNFHK